MKATPIIEQKSRYYRVKKGDTIESIAGEFGISAEKIEATNLLYDQRIKTGQTLVIPEFEEFPENLSPEESAKNNTFEGNG